MSEETVSVPGFRALSLQNFRGFRSERDIPLAPLTFLVGPNSSGKSSLFDSILLLTQSGVRVSPFLMRPLWTGPWVDLGSYDDTVRGHDRSRQIRIAIDVSLPDVYANVRSSRRVRSLTRARFDFVISASKTDPVGIISNFTARDLKSDEWLSVDYTRRQGATFRSSYGRRSRHVAPERSRQHPYFADWYPLEEQTLYQRGAAARFGRARLWGIRRLDYYLKGGLSGFLENAQRVSSGRAAPQRWYPTGIGSADLSTRGRQGPVFDKVDPSVVRATPPFGEAAYSALQRSRLGKDTLQSVLRELDIADRIADWDLSPYHSAIQVRDNITRVLSNLIDVGYGASQVIPVIRGCLSASSGPLFVEQPEIHLHPKGQGVLADLLCRTSLRRQVIVETHSVRMINRARLMVARGLVPAEHVAIDYVDRDAKGSHVQRIALHDDGEFASEWPSGFFDERYEDTMELLHLRSKPAGSD